MTAQNMAGAPARPLWPSAGIARADWLFLAAPMALGTGIWLWFALPAAPMRAGALLAGLLLALASLALRRPRPALTILGLALALGVAAAEYRALSVAPPRLYHRLTAFPVTGEIIAREARNGGAATRLIVRRPGNGTDAPHKVRITFDTRLPPAFRPGATIRVVATLGPFPQPVLPGAHDPARASWFEGLAATGHAMAAPQLLAPAHRPPLLARLDGLRQRLTAFIRQTLPSDPGGLAIALTVGDQGEIRPELAEAMRIAGLAHILTVSGFHIAVVVGGTLLMVRRLVGLWPWLALRLSGRTLGAIAAGLAGSFYALLSGAEVPAIRAAIMAWAVMLALTSGRQAISLRLLAMAAAIILLARPEALLSPGFQLSFAAVAALVAFAESRAGQWLTRPAPGTPALHRAGRYLLALIVTGLVAELVLSPIALAHFGRAGLYGVAANMLAIPLTSLVIMPLIGLFLLASPFGLAPLVAVPLGWALSLLAGIGEQVSGWPHAAVAISAVPPMAYASGMAAALLALLLAGRARLLALPVIAAALLLAIFLPRPDLFVSADARQVALVTADGLHALRPHRRGFQWRAWEQASNRRESVGLAHLPGSRCTASYCLHHADGRTLLLFRTNTHIVPSALCATADIIVAPMPLPPACQPRRARFDSTALVGSGAVAIQGAHHIRTSADIAGDHPWSPSALPGTRISLLGTREWTGVISE